MDHTGIDVHNRDSRHDEQETRAAMHAGLQGVEPVAPGLRDD
jgi:hypothetical protein